MILIIPYKHNYYVEEDMSDHKQVPVIRKFWVRLELKFNTEIENKGLANFIYIFYNLWFSILHLVSALNWLHNLDVC